jgi:hypothetical protein
MIGDSPLGSAVVRTSVRLASIPIDDQDPWHHWQELLRGRCGILFKARVLQQGELDLIKGCCEIRSRGGSYSHDVGHHCDLVWELDNYRAQISGCAPGKASAPNIHCRPYTIANECRL